MNKLLPFLEGWLYVPLQKIHSLDMLKSQLTVRSKYTKTMTGQQTKPILCYDENSHPGYIGVPPRYGIERLQENYKGEWKKHFIDKSSKGPRRIETPKQPDLHHPKAHPDQKLLVPQILDTLREDRCAMLEAPTGAGKTVMALSVIAQTRLKTVIFIDQEMLKEQWLKEIQDKLGIPPEEVGIIQGNKCQTDKDITLAMTRTVYKGKYREQMKSQFGLAIFDEVQTLGAEQLSATLGQVNPWCMLAMSATKDRQDGRCKAYKFFFGEGDVYAKAPALPLKVVVLPYSEKLPDWGTDRTSKVLAVSRDLKLSQRLAGIVFKLYEDGRNILVVADHKHQLKKVYEEAVALGIPAEVCGHFYTGGAVMQIPSNHGDVTLKEKQYFEWIKSHAKVIFSTYGMINKGVSIDRLDAGVDCTPRGDDKQLRGRVRRPFENKRLPVWYTLHHTKDKMFSNFCKKRIKDYISDESIELVRKDVNRESVKSSN